MAGEKSSNDVTNDRPEGESSGSDASNLVDPKLLSILVCPVTKTRLVYDQENNELISKAGHLAFPVRKGIPLLTRDAARPLDDEC